MTLSFNQWSENFIDVSVLVRLRGTYQSAKLDGNHDQKEEKDQEDGTYQPGVNHVV